MEWRGIIAFMIIWDIIRACGTAFLTKYLLKKKMESKMKDSYGQLVSPYDLNTIAEMHRKHKKTCDQCFMFKKPYEPVRYYSAYDLNTIATIHRKHKGK